MRLVVQRVLSGAVSIAGKVHGEIARGYVVFVGFGQNDDEDVVAAMAEKLWNLRIFEDDQGKMNLSILDVEGEILSISQFTLYADCRKGNRPGFSKALNPEKASALYDLFNKILDLKVYVATGVFGADMQVSLVNDGPVTIILDSERDLSISRIKRARNE